MNRIAFLGALILVPPLFQARIALDPVERAGRIEWFTLAETRAEITRRFGPPAMVTDYGAVFQSWQYQLDNADHDAFSHQLVFRKATGELVSAAHNYEPERNVDRLFPAAETRIESAPADSKAPMLFRVRRAGPNKLLLAWGGAGKLTAQILLIRENELGSFYPWLAERLRPSRPPN